MTLKLLLRTFIYTFSLFAAITVFAGPPDRCVSIKGLARGFHYNKYQQCKDAIQQCPADGASVSEECLKEKSKIPACYQLAALAKQIEHKADLMEVRPVGKYQIVTTYFPADGAEHYSVLSPKGCVVNATIDPSSINKNFKKIFGKKDLFIVPLGAPSYTQLANGIHRFTITVEGRNVCRACETLVTATMAFDFNKNDKYSGASLLSYK